MSISEEKSALRQALRRRLAQSDPADNAACDVAITIQVLALPEFQAAERIFAYCSVLPEVDTHAILAQARRRGKTVALPVPEAGGQMYFARYDGALVPGRYGIPQPPRSAPVLQPQPGDLMLVPALAYDRAGRRLGRDRHIVPRRRQRVEQKFRTDEPHSAAVKRRETAVLVPAAAGYTASDVPPTMSTSASRI